ncbi:MAG: undecaprenyl-phosphate glucose phosphotransferase [Chitinophagaceae bacterium]|nr:undecaprenyl-phosphate glucose phosphotransferase [Chitinophagaceae bacterium]
MNRRFLQFLQLTLVSLDLLILNAIYLMVRLFLHNRIGDENFMLYFQYWAILNSCWIILSWIGKVYSSGSILSFESFTKRTMRIYVIWVLSIFFYLFLSHKLTLSRLFVTSTCIAFGVGLLINRFAYIGIRDYFRNSDNFGKKIVILGYNDIAKKLASYLEQEGINMKVLGFAEDFEKVTELSHYPILSGVNESLEISKKLQVNEIFSTITPEQDNNIYNLMKEAEAECIRFRIVPDLSSFIRRPVHIDYLRDIPIISLRSEPLDDVANRINKRAFDVAISILVIVFILSWLIPIISIFILLESRGPVFFVQQRTGKDNKPFGCIKFRSMKVNKDANTMQASRGDARITRVGRFLRRSNLDEFPQFINVLMGDMSVVGPRPHMLKHTDDYSKLINQYMVRQFLKPGITGWAQVNGYRGETKDLQQMKGRVEYDLWYMENWSVWLDIKIMFLTVYNVFRGEPNAF